MKRIQFSGFEFGESTDRVRSCIGPLERCGTCLSPTWHCSPLTARIVTADPAKGMAGAVDKARDLTAGNPDAVMLQQFDNPANADVHRSTTGPEIWRDTNGKVDVLVCGVGTGGTITGTGEYLKSQNPNIKVRRLHGAYTGAGKAPCGLWGCTKRLRWVAVWPMTSSCVVPHACASC